MNIFIFENIYKYVHTSCRLFLYFRILYFKREISLAHSKSVLYFNHIADSHNKISIHI